MSVGAVAVAVEGFPPFGDPHRAIRDSDPHLIDSPRYTQEMQDPFAHLNLEQIQAAARKDRAQHPVLWWVAAFVVFIRDPRRWVRGWYRRRAIGYRD